MKSFGLLIPLRHFCPKFVVVFGLYWNLSFKDRLASFFRTNHNKVFLLIEFEDFWPSFWPALKSLASQSVQVLCRIWNLLIYTFGSFVTQIRVVSDLNTDFSHILLQFLAFLAFLDRFRQNWSSFWPVREEFTTKNKFFGFLTILSSF